jgi:hypothetical protein
MTYAIEILEKDRQLLEQCLDGWHYEPDGKVTFAEAMKDRENKLKEVNKAIEILKGVRQTLPSHIQEALNSGDGIYRP